VVEEHDPSPDRLEVRRNCCMMQQLLRAIGLRGNPG
jgi:hypothetical protein